MNFLRDPQTIGLAKLDAAFDEFDKTFAPYEPRRDWFVALGLIFVAASFILAAYWFGYGRGERYEHKRMIDLYWQSNTWEI